MRLNVLLAVLAAAVLAAFVVLYFVMSGGSGDDLDNGLSVEEQSPVIEQKPAEASAPIVEETPEPDRQEEEAALENGDEETAPSDMDESADTTQPDAPQAAPQDPFTVELQEGVDEMNDIVQKMRDRFPNSDFAEILADFLTDFGFMLMRYDAELSRQSLTREERIAKLKQRADEFGNQFEGEMQSAMAGLDPTSGAAEAEAVSQFLDSNVPQKLTQLLGL